MSPGLKFDELEESYSVLHMGEGEKGWGYKAAGGHLGFIWSKWTLLESRGRCVRACRIAGHQSRGPEGEAASVSVCFREAFWDSGA